MEQPYFLELKEKIRQEYNQFKCYPAPQNIFRAFQLCPPEKVRVVWVSQDPYPKGEADGLTFSTQQEEIPFSLKQVFRELDRDILKTKNKDEFKSQIPSNDLSPWASKGILMLNSCLTVRAGEINSHHEWGWERFISSVLTILQEDSKLKVFVTFGADAREVLLKSKVPQESPHGYFDAGHPASGAHGVDLFSGCNIFSKTNHFFNKHNQPPINWKLNE